MSLKQYRDCIHTVLNIIRGESGCDVQPLALSNVEITGNPAIGKVHFYGRSEEELQKFYKYYTNTKCHKDAIIFFRSKAIHSQLDMKIMIVTMNYSTRLTGYYNDMMSYRNSGNVASTIPNNSVRWPGPSRYTCILIIILLTIMGMGSVIFFSMCFGIYFWFVK